MGSTTQLDWWTGNGITGTGRAELSQGCTGGKDFLVLELLHKLYIVHWDDNVVNIMSPLLLPPYYYVHKA